MREHQWGNSWHCLLWLALVYSHSGEYSRGKQGPTTLASWVKLLTSWISWSIPKKMCCKYEKGFSLRSCQEFEALQQIIIAERLYLQSTSPPTPQQISVLSVFHADLVPTPQDVFHCAKMSCDEFLAGAKYLHRRVMLAGKDGMLNELYADVISKHRTLCGGWCQAQETSSNLYYLTFYSRPWQSPGDEVGRFGGPALSNYSDNTSGKVAQS